jgi:hypothetical protein
MGNTFCSNYDADSSMPSKDYLRTLSNMAPKTGGGSVTTIGGYDSLEDYGNTNALIISTTFSGLFEYV